MREMKKLAKRGWWKAMVHQGTLSLILTLDDFLISGPHLCTQDVTEAMLNPNIFVVKNQHENGMEFEEMEEKHRIAVSTYYVLRPHIRGILYGLNPLYQISLYVPCRDPRKKALYHELISKIDIGRQFFQDRIYWNYEALRNDIMDSRLACLIHAGSLSLDNDWLAKVGIEYKPFFATLDTDLSMSNNLFDLVEMRSFLEDAHQRYFSLLNESKRLYFSNMIRLHIDEVVNKTPTATVMSANTSGFYSGTNSQTSPNKGRQFRSEGNSVRIPDKKKKLEFLFRTEAEAPLTWKIPNVDLLLDEYEDIIQEQLEINHAISQVSPMKTSFAKTLCRWNTITQRKSDVLKQLMSHTNKDYIHERLRHLNSVYCMKKFQSESDLFASEPSAKSNASSDSEPNSNLLLPKKSEPKDGCEEKIPQFTIWYINNV